MDFTQSALLARQNSQGPRGESETAEGLGHAGGQRG